MGARRRNSYILTRILIILAIVIPFILKSIDSHLEPYPAIIFPGGAGTTKSPKNGYIFYDKQEIFALTHDSKKVKIQRSDLFIDIPENFQKLIVDKRFNMKEKRKINIEKQIGTFLLTINIKKSIQKDKQKKYILEKLKTIQATKNEKIKALIIRKCNYRKNIKNKSPEKLLDCNKENYIGLTSDL